MDNEEVTLLHDDRDDETFEVPFKNGGAGHEWLVRRYQSEHEPKYEWWVRDTNGSSTFHLHATGSDLKKGPSRDYYPLEPRPVP